MQVIISILNFFKNIFNKSKNNDCVICDNRSTCQTVDKNKRYAIIIGVETSKWGSCPGSRKDSNMMYDMISQYTSNIVRLNDSSATVNKVRDALKEQIEKVTEDGICYITYSGHGGQTPKKTNASNETDGKDEFLCLYDGYILDDELWTIFGECKGRIFVVFDCCHSSTMFRLPSEPVDENLDDAENRLPLDTPFFARFENARSSISMFVISGCDESTVSWGDSIQGGVLTSSLKRAFDKCLTYKEWWNKTRIDNAFKKVKQVPIATRIGSFDVNSKVFN